MSQDARLATVSISRDRISRVGACIALGLLAISGAGCIDLTPRQTTLASDYEVLPTTAFEGKLFVEARLNGAGPFRLLVDTGATGLFLTPHVVQAAALRPLRGRTISIHGAMDRSVGQLVDIDVLETGGLKLHGMRAAVVSDEALVNIERSLGSNFDGAMGMASFADVILEIDFPKGTVAVGRPSAMSYPRERAVRYTGSTPHVTVDFAGQRVECQIDTGSFRTLEVPDLHPLPLSYPPVKDDGRGDSGIGAKTVRSETSQLAGDARLGPVTWHNPPLVRAAEGRIGINALSSSKLAFDQREELVYFLAEQHVAQWDREDPPDPAYKAGFFCALEGDTVRLLEVDPGFALDRAGLRARDVVTTINGAPAASWLMASEGQWGSTLALEVLRDGAEFEAIVTLGPPAE